MIRLSRLDRKNPSAGRAKFYAQRQILWIISGQLCIALQYHDARYLCGGKGMSDGTMSTFNFINAASRNHATPVKQRASVSKHSKEGSPPGVSVLTDEKAPERLRFRGHDKIKKSVATLRENNISRVIISCDYVDEIINIIFSFTLGVVSRNK